MTIAERLRDFRVNALAKIVPRHHRAPSYQCGGCGGPAMHVTGRHSGRLFVVPAGCGHHPYPVEDGWASYLPSERAVAALDALMSMTTKDRNIACTGWAAKEVPCSRTRKQNEH